MNQLNLHHTTLTSLMIDKQTRPLLPLLPNTLHQLYIRYGFNHPIHEWHLPPSITELNLGNTFNPPLDGVTLPASVRTLEWGEAFNQLVEQIILPSCLLSFTITTRKFNHPIESLVLPPSLRKLDMSAIALYTHPLSRLHLPPHLHSPSLPVSMRTNDEGGCDSLTLPAAQSSSSHLLCHTR